MANPDIKFLLAHPAHFFAQGFGSGLSPKAPGTFGTLMGLPLFWLISSYTLHTQLLIITALFLIGIYFCHGQLSLNLDLSYGKNKCLLKTVQ